MTRDPHVDAGGERAAAGAGRELHVELLLGRKVVDASGEVVGRIEEVVAEVEDGEPVVRHFLVGKYALIDRLGGGRLARALARLLARGRAYEGYAIPWDAIDLSDPEHPRTRVPKHELAAGRASGPLEVSQSF